MSEQVLVNGSWKKLVRGVPYATKTSAGAVKVGNGLDVASDGTISVSAEDMAAMVQTILEQRLGEIYMYAKDGNSPVVDPPVGGAS